MLHQLKLSDNRIDLDWIVRPLWEAIDKESALPNKERKSELRREVSSLLLEIKQKNNTVPYSDTRDKLHLNGFYKIAAILILVFGVTFGLLNIFDRSQSTITYIESTSAKGEKKSLLLTDGTNVILNSDTKLIIPSDFNNKERIIEIEGEAFFDVTLNPDKPFILKSGETRIKVLGTSFDFKLYKEDEFIKLTVSTGKVQINVADQELQLSVSSNEHLSINKKDGNIRKETIEENNYIKWIHSSLYFNREPIREVIKTINRTYNRTVILQSEEADYRITGIHHNKSIDAVIEAICFTTGLQYRHEDENIILYETQ